MTEPTSPEQPGPCPAVPEPLLKWLDRVVAHPEVSWDQLHDERERLAVAYDSGRRAVEDTPDHRTECRVFSLTVYSLDFGTVAAQRMVDRRELDLAKHRNHRAGLTQFIWRRLADEIVRFGPASEEYFEECEE